MTNREWIMTPFFLLGCWCVIDAIATVIHNRARRKARGWK